MEMQLALADTAVTYKNSIELKETYSNIPVKVIIMTYL